MVSSHASSSRTCPTCGAHNSELSIFCAECGAGLNGGPWESDGQTEAFQHAVTGSEGSWNTPVDTGRQSTATGTTSVDDTDDTAHAAETPRYSTFNHGYGAGAVVASWSTASEDRGTRGFWLGMLAWLLILAVFCIYLWSAALSSGLREDIRDLFPGL